MTWTKLRCWLGAHYWLRKSAFWRSLPGHSKVLIGVDVCERCDHVFNWAQTRHRPNGTAADGSRVCPRCQTEFVRKFRESDLDRVLAEVADVPLVVEAKP